MKTNRITSCIGFVVAVLATALHAEDLSVRLNVGTNAGRVTLSVVAENNTGQAIDLATRWIDNTRTNRMSSTLSWQVNGQPAKFKPKRSFTMIPLFDTRLLPAHSTNAVILVEDDELFFVSETTNTHSRLAGPALPTTGEYRIEVSTAGDWGGHTTKTATVTIRIKKEPPTNACTLSATSAEK
jgi:hypothetical protein